MGAIREVTIVGDDKKNYVVHKFNCDVCNSEVSGPSLKGVKDAAERHVSKTGHKQA